MQLIDNSVTLIVVGAWNPSILQPRWMIKYGLGIDEHTDVTVNIDVPMQPGQPLRFSVRGISYTATSERLTFFVDACSDEQLNEMENIVKRILTTLPHTPVTAFGQNFEFVDDSPNEEILDMFTFQDPAAANARLEYEIKSTALVSRLEFADCLLNLRRELSDGNVQYGFNFHYERSDPMAAADALGGTFVQNYGRALDFMKSYTNQD